jgi:hypothetical protein
MKHLQPSSIFRGAIVVTLVVVYAVFGVALTGLVTSSQVALVAFVGAFVGGLAALGFLITSSREIERQYRRP